MTRKVLTLLALAMVAPPACRSSANGCANRGGREKEPAGPVDVSAQAGDGTSRPTLRSPPGEAKTHPRLFVRESDVARLRSWANEDNPMWAQGIKPLAEECKTAMDDGSVAKDDPGAPNTYVTKPPEALAMLFAFMSLVSPSPAERADYAKRAKKLLMRVIDEAAKGVKAGAPFRDPDFSIGDRSRWHGASFPLTVDWIYPSLSADEKKKIRSVFLRWAAEKQKSEFTTDNHPEPIGVVNDPKLTADRKRVRWAANNYYTAHARNLGLMAMAFDAADDPDEKLRSHLPIVTGAWLYVFDALTRGDMKGGLGAEGFEYSPQANGYIAQLLLALYTAGRADAAAYGRQATFDNPFWDDSVTAFFHSISPAPKATKADDEPRYQVAWYGDGQISWAPDFMSLFGPMGVYDHYTGNDKRLAHVRWIETHTPPGGAAQRADRVRGDHYLESLFYFLLFDPKAPDAPDPRPTFPLLHFAEGMGRFLGRTSWAANASWFSYKLGYSTIDHQHADGNMFELWRKGEWLTKERTGYGDDIACSDQKNTIAIQNDKPTHHDGYRGAEWKRGSQWTYVCDGDGKILASHVGRDFVYFLGDATALHNSKYEGSTNVAHASRSIVWLPPDRVITYDRAASKSDGRFKRFFMQLPSRGTVANGLMTMRTAGGQQLFVRTLLPKQAAITVTPAEPLEKDGDRQPADGDPIRFRLAVEAPGSPRSVRWLHVVQGADGNAAPDAASVVSAAGGAFEGAAFNGTVVMFPVDVGAPHDSLTYAAPAGTKAHLLTGLAPGTGYKVTTQPAADGVTVTVTRGGDQKTDSGGVLVIGKLP